MAKEDGLMDLDNDSPLLSLNELKVDK